MAAVAYQLALIPQKCLQQCIEATPLCRLQNAIAMCLVMWECRPVSKIFVWNYVSPWTKAALLDQWRNPLYAMVVFFVRKILLLWYSVIHFITFFKDIFMYVFFCIKCQLIRLFFFRLSFFSSHLVTNATKRPYCWISHSTFHVLLTAFLLHPWKKKKNCPVLWSLLKSWEKSEPAIRQFSFLFLAFLLV